MSFTNDIINFLTTNPQYGNFLAFFFAFIESLAVIGSIVPGSVTMTAIGSLVGLNVLAFAPVLAFSITGAIIGDLVSFYAGLFYKEQILELKILAKYKNLIIKAESFIQKYGISSIIIGRFFGPFRSMLPMVAGVLNMSPKKFILAAIPASILWSIVYLGPGIILGSFSADFPGYIPLNLVLYFILFLASIIIFTKAVKYYIKKFKILSILQARLKNKFFSAQQTKYLALSLLFAIGFSISAISNYHAWLLTINESIYSLMQSLWNNPTNHILLAITFFADKKALFFASILGCLLVFKNNKQLAYTLFIYIIITALIIKITKVFFHIPRPPIVAPFMGHTSFPSGHMSFITAILSFTWLLAKEYMASSLQKNIVKYFCTLFPAIIAISRIYLGAHWLNDVLGGAMLGLCIAHLFYALIEQKIKLDKPIFMPHLIFIAWISAAGFLIFKHYQVYYNNFFPVNNIITITKNQLTSDNPIIKTIRENQFGHKIDIINIRWIGDLNIIRSTLKKDGWQCSDHNVQDIQNWLVRTNKNICSVPLSPPKLDKFNPAIAAVKKLSSAKHAVIFIWPSFLTFNKQKVWLGTMYVESSNYPLSTIKPKKFTISPIEKIAKNQVFTINKHEQISWDNKILILGIN